MLASIIMLCLLSICNCFTLKSQLLSQSIASSRRDGSEPVIQTNLVPESSTNRIHDDFLKVLQYSKLTFTSIAAISVVNTLSLKPALAITSLEAANNKLAGYGLPPILFVPEGFSTVVSEFGRGNVREKMSSVPILVQFAYPAFWIVSTTTINNNGEAGTISAGDYNKGDSAFFYTATLSDGEDITKKEFIKNYIIKSKFFISAVVDSCQVVRAIINSIYVL